MILRLLSWILANHIAYRFWHFSIHQNLQIQQKTLHRCGLQFVCLPKEHIIYISMHRTICKFAKGAHYLHLYAPDDLAPRRSADFEFSDYHATKNCLPIHQFLRATVRCNMQCVIDVQSPARNVFLLGYVCINDQQLLAILDWKQRILPVYMMFTPNSWRHPNVRNNFHSFND